MDDRLWFLTPGTQPWESQEHRDQFLAFLRNRMNYVAQLIARRFAECEVDGCRPCWEIEIDGETRRFDGGPLIEKLKIAGTAKRTKDVRRRASRRLAELNTLVGTYQQTKQSLKLAEVLLPQLDDEGQRDLMYFTQQLVGTSCVIQGILQGEQEHRGLKPPRSKLSREQEERFASRAIELLTKGSKPSEVADKIHKNWDQWILALPQNTSRNKSDAKLKKSTIGKRVAELGRRATP